MTLVLSLILSLYCLLLLVFLFGWVRIRRQPMPVKGGSTPGISIVVPLRNEQENIQNLVLDLSAIVYPLQSFEVILVNDHSTDETGNQISTLTKSIANFRVFDLPEGKEGKKQALLLGIEKATFEIIATTDADCQFSKHWLECISPYFERKENKMLVGGVKLKLDRSLFSRLQVVEFISLVGCAGAAIGLGHPVMCNGANLAFRKNVFQEVGGYDENLQIASGDDEFLMRKIFNRYPEGVKFMNYYEGVVTSRPQKTIRDFFYQRLRWAGKWRYNSDTLTQLLAAFILISQIAFVGIVIKNIMALDGSLGLAISKLFLEGVFLVWVGRFLERKFDLPAFLALQILYPIYVTVIALSSFVMPYRWKNRNYK